MPVSHDVVHRSALETAAACFKAVQDELAEANAIIADLRSKLPSDAPEQPHPKPPADETDREALYAYLDKAGYRRSGDLVFLTPVRPSRTVERHKSDHTVVANIVTETREQLVFAPFGARLERFRKNPIVLYNHDYEGLPVARSLWERVRDGDHGPELVAKPQFHMDTCLSREVWQLIVDGRLTAWELGVIPEKWEKRGEGYYVTAWDVLEYSVVPRPEDIPALREERRQRRVTSPALVKSIMADVEKGEVDDA